MKGGMMVLSCFRVLLIVFLAKMVDRSVLPAVTAQCRHWTGPKVVKVSPHAWHSVSRPLRYDSEVCEWLLEAPLNHFVQLRIDGVPVVTPGVEILGCRTPSLAVFFGSPSKRKQAGEFCNMGVKGCTELKSDHSSVLLRQRRTPGTDLGYLPPFLNWSYTALTSDAALSATITPSSQTTSSDSEGSSVTVSNPAATALGYLLGFVVVCAVIVLCRRRLCPPQTQSDNSSTSQPHPRRTSRRAAEPDATPSPIFTVTYLRRPRATSSTNDTRSEESHHARLNPTFETAEEVGVVDYDQPPPPYSSLSFTPDGRVSDSEDPADSDATLAVTEDSSPPPPSYLESSKYVNISS